LNLKQLTKTQKLTISAMVLACYIVIMYLTQGFAFGAYQIRNATAIYSLAYLFPFLVVPLGLSNLLSNALMGGFGLYDIVGGGLVGVTTAGLVYLIRRYKLNQWLIALPIIFVPGLGVSTYLSYLLGIPYPAMALSLCIGQIIPGFVGVLLVKALDKRII